MRSGDIELVRELDLFAGMAETNFAELMQAAYLQRFPRQVQLITEGEPADFLHVVVEGSVELFARANGRETVMGILQPVSTFILAAVLQDALYLMSARTIEKSRILMIPSENIRAVLESDAAFAQAIVHELAGAFRGMVKSLKNQKLRGSVERLANYLLAQHDAQGSTGGLQLPVDKRTLAALLGMTPENLSRAFAALNDQGVVVKGRSVTLRDLPALREVARPTPLIDDPAS